MSNRKFNTKRINKGIIAGALALSLVISSTGSIVVNKTKVEAKKKNTKPKLTLKGKLKKKKLTIKEGETVKINATAKDKEDGNLNKKIKIAVKKPTNGKYKKTGKTIKFINDGTYKVTVSVKDSKKAKASQTIKVVVKDKENTNANTNGPVPYTNEEPKVVETPKPTVKPTEVPETTKKPQVTGESLPMLEEFSKYDIKQVKVGDITYNITEDAKFAEDYITPALTVEANDYNIELENDYYRLCFLPETKDEVIDNYTYLKVIGNIYCNDSKGINNSNNIIMYTSPVKMDKCVYFYSKDSYGKESVQEIRIFFGPNPYDLVDPNSERYDESYNLVCEDPVCIAQRRNWYTLAKTMRKK